MQRVASFHGVSASSHGSAGDQLAPLNLSKRRKSEDFGSASPGLLGGESASSESQYHQLGAFGSGLNNWPPPACGGSLVKRESEEEVPLNLVCREQYPSASATTSSSPSLRDMDSRVAPFTFSKHRQELGVIHDDDDLTSSTATSSASETTSTALPSTSSSNIRKLMRFSSYDGTF